VRRLRLAVVFLAVAGLVDAGYLTILKIQLMQHGLGCAFGGCDVVNQSPYSVFLGVPVAAWGFLTYGLLLLLALLWRRASAQHEVWLGWSVCAVSGWGVVFSAYLTAIELFVLNAVCPFCVVSAFLIICIFVLAAIDVWRPTTD